MKRFGTLLLATAMVLSLVACGSEEKKVEDAASSVEAVVDDAAPDADAVVEDVAAPADEVVADDAAEEDYIVAMSYDEYVAAELDSEVILDVYVQATQSWWDNKITVYAADENGGYFIYNMACTEEEAALLVPGTEILVDGYKSEWAGEVEVAEGATFAFVEDGDTYVADMVDVNEIWGTDAIADYMNQKIYLSDMVVSAVSYKNNEPGDDIYVNFVKDDVEYYFCLEYYLNGSDEELYDLVGNLEVGQVCDVAAYLYWYEGPNPHITGIRVYED